MKSQVSVEGWQACWRAKCVACEQRGMPGATHHGSRWVLFYQAVRCWPDVGVSGCAAWFLEARCVDGAVTRARAAK